MMAEGCSGEGEGMPRPSIVEQDAEIVLLAPEIALPASEAAAVSAIATRQAEARLVEQAALLEASSYN